MPDEHVEEMKAADPLPRLRQLMLDHQFGEAALDAIVAQVQAEIDQAWDFAAASPLPGPEEPRRDAIQSRWP